MKHLASTEQNKRLQQMPVTIIDIIINDKIYSVPPCGGMEPFA